MPHVAFVPFTGFRVREAQMLELGMRLPGLAARAEAIAALPALGLLTLAAHNPPDWTCSYHPASSEKDELDSLLEHLLETPADLVAVSALTASIESAIAFSAELRRHNIPVVIGGLHATAVPETLAPHFDAVVVGDGEPVWEQLLHDVERDELKPLYRAAKQFDLRDSRTPRFDLLSLPSPPGRGAGGQGTGRNGDPLNGDPRHPHPNPSPRGRGALPPRFTLQTQRGCPFACEFCGASRLLGGFREKPAAHIRRELEAISATHPRPIIELADDNTFAGNRNVDELFDALRESNARYFTEADWRIGEREDILGGLAESGCAQVLVGMESLVKQPRGMGAKNASLARIMDAVAAIQERGVCVIGCFILGCDGETDETIDRLIEFVLACPLADVQLTLQTPFPGTALYARMKRDGRLLEDRGWSAYTLFDVAYRPEPMTVDELERGFVRAAETIFAEGPAARRTRIRRQTWARARRKLL